MTIKSISSTDIDFRKKYSEFKKIVDNALLSYLPKETKYNNLILKAIKYSLFSGGKRVRPILSLVISKCFNKKFSPIIPLICALEYIHTYSLIHDDLPSMDNDDFRRGKPTSHKVFGEATAILTGDALLSLAFELVTNYIRKTTNKTLIAKYVGINGLISGQIGDLTFGKIAAEKFRDKCANIPATANTEKDILEIYKMKTASLFIAAAEIGAINCFPNSDKVIEKFRHFGKYFGIAFQLKDDLDDLNSKGDTCTYPKIFGVEATKTKIKIFLDKAMNELNCFGDKINLLHQFVRFVIGEF